MRNKKPELVTGSVVGSGRVANSTRVDRSARRQAVRVGQDTAPSRGNEQGRQRSLIVDTGVVVGPCACPEKQGVGETALA